jgi:hypothetical protein
MWQYVQAEIVESFEMPKSNLNTIHVTLGVTIGKPNAR